MDWLYRRLAKLDQEQASGVTANIPNTEIITPAGGPGSVRVCLGAANLLLIAIPGPILRAEESV